jgi:hypothetical protein
MCHAPRIYPAQVKAAARHAKLLCEGYEDTLECKNAWKRVEYIEKAYKDQQKADEMIRKEMHDDI